MLDVARDLTNKFGVKGGRSKSMRYIFSVLQHIRHAFFPALLLALSLFFLFPGNSQAHAVLLRSDPAQGAILTTAPSQISMWFTEDLNPNTSTATVINSAQHRLDLNNAHISPNDTREMDISLQPLLAPGTYSVQWTTQSADDGYVLRGSFLFSVTEPNGTIPKTNGSLPGQNSATSDSNANLSDGPTFFSFIMVTLVDLSAIFWVGAQLWRTFVLQLITTKSGNEYTDEYTIAQKADARFERKFALPLLLLLLLANIGIIVGQALTLTNGNNAQPFTFSTLVNLATIGHFGTYWAMREIVVLLATILAIISLTLKNIPKYGIEFISWLNLILGMALLIALTMSSDASAANDTTLIFSAMLGWLHLLAASLWIGGMLYISTIYLPMLKESTLTERTDSLLSTLSHHLPLAITGVIIMAITGPFDTTTQMNSSAQLLTTAYGRALVIKIVLVAALLIISAIYSSLLRPHLAKDYKKYLALVGVEQRETVTIPESGASSIQEGAQEVLKPLEAGIEQQTRQLTSILRWQPLLGIAVLICSALLSVLAGTLQPGTANPAAQSPAAVQVKTFSTTLKTSDKLFTFKLSISPDQAGPNTFTITVFDSHGVKDTNVSVTIYATMLDMDMGTTPINLQADGKGNFSTSGNLDMGGNWGLRVQIRAPDQKLHEASLKITATD
jgi:copper transport protein